jgi:long-chain acyl-CoA synthetase
MGCSLFQIIESKANETPDAIAFAYKSNASWFYMSYHEYLERANKLASSLCNLGIKKGDVISSFSNNCVELNILDLALLKIGAWHAIYFPNYGQENLIDIINKTKPKLIFAGSGVFLSILQKVNSQLKEPITLYAFEKNNKNVKTIYEITENTRSANTHVHVSENEIYSMYFTSGTTGSTKGVLVSNKAIVATIQELKLLFRLKSGDSAISFAPLAVSSERCLNYFYQCSGITTYYPESMEQLIPAIQYAKPSIFLTSPLMLNKIKDNVYAELSKMPSGVKKYIFEQALNFTKKRKNIHPTNIYAKLKKRIFDTLIYVKLRAVLGGRVKFIVSGGAASSKDVLIFFHNIGIPVYEGYGMTECHIIAVNKPDDASNHFDSVGTSFGKTAIKINNNGELLCKSPYMFEGYFDNEKLTRESFTQDGYFKTGDKGIVERNGEVKIVGRIKVLFKSQAGIYINPEQIEAQLNQSDIIEQSMVIGDNKPFLSALIFPTETIRALEKNKQAKAIETIINKYNQNKVEAEQIVRFEILDSPFSIQNNELTPSGKMIRSLIKSNYNRLIKTIYET